MEQALRALLASALPHVPAAHINWGEHPQSMGRPYMVLHLISTNSGHTASRALSCAMRLR